MAGYYKQLTTFLIESMEENPVEIIIDEPEEEIVVDTVTPILESIIETLKSLLLQGEFSEEYTAGYYTGIYKAIENIEKYVPQQLNGISQ